MPAKTVVILFVPVVVNEVPLNVPPVNIDLLRATTPLVWLVPINVNVLLLLTVRLVPLAPNALLVVAVTWPPLITVPPL